MPQHLWISGPPLLTADLFRVCEVCRALQLNRDGGWSPHVSAICPGDDDDGPLSGGRRRPRPHLPTSGPDVRVRELEPA